MVGDAADIDKHNRDAERFLKRASGTVIVVLLEYFLLSFSVYSASGALKCQISWNFYISCSFKILTKTFTVAVMRNLLNDSFMLILVRNFYRLVCFYQTDCPLV